MIIVHSVLWAIGVLIALKVLRELFRRLFRGRIRAALAVIAIPLFPLALLMAALALAPKPLEPVRSTPVVTPYNPLAEWERSLAAKAEDAPKEQSAAHQGFAKPDPIVGRATVVDGDTIEIRGVRLRLQGVDAPESDQTCRDAGGKDYRCGQKAASALAEKIGTITVTCEPAGQDPYDRTLATCRVESIDLGGWIVGQGLGLAYRKYSTAYVPQEDTARTAKRGLWAGTFVPPWGWRSSRRAALASTEIGDSPKLPVAAAGIPPAVSAARAARLVAQPAPRARSGRGGCGSRGGPGYRLANGRCATWRR